MSLEAMKRLQQLASSLSMQLTELESSPSYLMVLDAAEGSETHRRFGSAAREIGAAWDGLAVAGSALDALDPASAGSEVYRDITRADLSFPPQRPGVGPTASTSTPGGSRRYSVTTLLEELRRRIDAMQVAVDAVDHRWHTILPRLQAAQDTLVRQRGELERLSISEPLVSMAERRAEELVAQLTSDPMRIEVDDAADFDRLVADAVAQIARLRTGHDNLASDLAAAESVLAEIRVLRARAEAARTEADEKVRSDRDAGHRLVRVPDVAVIDGPGGLAETLDELVGNGLGPSQPGGGGPDRQWLAIRDRLDRWSDTARRLRTQLERAEVTNRLPLEHRDELRGRLSAYMAKMSATGQAENLELTVLVDRIHDHLYVAPADVDDADELLTDLARRLRA